MRSRALVHDRTTLDRDQGGRPRFLGELVRYLCFLTAVILWGLTAWLVMP